MSWYSLSPSPSLALLVARASLLPLSRCNFCSIYLCHPQAAPPPLRRTSRPPNTSSALPTSSPLSSPSLSLPPRFPPFVPPSFSYSPMPSCCFLSTQNARQILDMRLEKGGTRVAALIQRRGLVSLMEADLSGNSSPALQGTLLEEGMREWLPEPDSLVDVVRPSLPPSWGLPLVVSLPLPDSSPSNLPPNTHKTNRQAHALRLHFPGSTQRTCWSSCARSSRPSRLTAPRASTTISPTACSTHTRSPAQR